MTKTGAMLVVIFLLCGVVQAQKTSAAFDEKVDFSNFKTYAFDKEGARNPYVNALIVEAIERELTARLSTIGIPPEDRPYNPHLTLARVREPAGLRAAALLDGLQTHAFGHSTIDAITLFESRLSPKGPTYVAQARAAFVDRRV